MRPQTDKLLRFHDSVSAVSVSLPERVALEYEIADIGTRFYALLLDNVMRAIIYGVLIYALPIAAAGIAMLGRGSDTSWMLAVFVVVVFLIEYGYFAVFEIAMNGRTLGKYAFGLRVVKEDGSSLTRADILLRNLIRIFDSMPLLNALGLVVMLISPRAQRLGDIAARTIVIRERSPLRAEWLARDAYVRQVPPDTVPLPGIRRFGPAELYRIQDFLTRRGNFTNLPALAALLARDARARLGEHAAECARMGDLELLERIDYDGRAVRLD